MIKKITKQLEYFLCSSTSQIKFKFVWNLEMIYYSFASWYHHIDVWREPGHLSSKTTGLSKLTHFQEIFSSNPGCVYILTVIWIHHAWTGTSRALVRLGWEVGVQTLLTQWRQRHPLTANPSVYGHGFKRPLGAFTCNVDRRSGQGVVLKWFPQKTGDLGALSFCTWVMGVWTSTPSRGFSPDTGL